MLKYALYFIIGGTVVSVSTWAGSLGRSWLAAFVSTLPTLTVLTFIFINQSAGAAPTVPYAKNLLYFVLPWLAYVGFYLLTVEQFSFWVALVGSIVVFVGVAALTKLVM